MVIFGHLKCLFLLNCFLKSKELLKSQSSEKSLQLKDPLIYWDGGNHQNHQPISTSGNWRLQLGSSTPFVSKRQATVKRKKKNLTSHEGKGAWRSHLWCKWLRSSLSRGTELRLWFVLGFLFPLLMWLLPMGRAGNVFHNWLYNGIASNVLGTDSNHLERSLLSHWHPRFCLRFIWINWADVWGREQIPAGVWFCSRSCVMERNGSRRP